jgi:hypothetical protein
VWPGNAVAAEIVQKSPGAFLVIWATGKSRLRHKKEIKKIRTLSVETSLLGHTVHVVFK